MPVTYGTFTKQLKLLPLVLQANGGATVTVRYGYVGEDGEFTASTEQQFAIEPDKVSELLDAKPVQGLSRRNDLSFAIYGYLVKVGLVEAGQIT
jgi:hypothetical protein